MPTSLTVYRGEKKEWWPPPEIRLMNGMTLLEPWDRNNSVTEIWAKLRDEIRQQPGKNIQAKVAAYAQYLRASGHPFALATAATNVGSYTSDYNYVIEIPTAYLYYWGEEMGAPVIGDAVPVNEYSNVKADFVVLDAARIDASSILGFGHKTGTREVTFFHDMPIDLVKTCDDEEISSMTIKTKQDLTFDEKIKYRKFLR